MNFVEALGIALLMFALVLIFVSFFIPRSKILKIRREAIPPSISGHFSYLDPIHGIPFWMLNSFGKTFRVTMDASGLLGLLLINIDFWFG